MEQTNSLAMNMLQSIASQAAGIPKTSGKTDSDGLSDFQKLLDEKAQEKDPLMEQPAKTQAQSKPTTPAKKTENAPVQQKENALERVKKLAEQGAWFSQPNIGCVQIDLETGETIATYQPGEYILAHVGGQTEIIPINDLDPSQMLELKKLLSDMGQAIDVSDPEVDALLEATDPNVKHSAAEALEEVVEDQIGHVGQKAVEETLPQDQDDDGQVEVLDAEQAPQRIFRDVQHVPVKVGEAEETQQTDEPNVAQQIDSQLVQAMQKGESMVRIQLTPENLGTVTVEISQSAQGILRVALSAHSTETRALLERHAGDLQGLLSSRTQQNVEVDVQRQQESQQGQQHQNYEGHNGHAQDQQRERRQQREHTSSQDFMQQLRLGLIPTDGV